MISFPGDVDPELQRRAHEIAEKFPDVEITPVVGSDHLWLRFNAIPPIAIKLTHDIELEVWTYPGVAMDVNIELRLAEHFDYRIKSLMSLEDEAYKVLGPFVAKRPVDIPPAIPPRRFLTRIELLLVALLIISNVLWLTNMVILGSRLQGVQSYAEGLQQREACRHHNPVQREEFYEEAKQVALYDCGAGTLLVEVWVPGTSDYEFAFTKVGAPLELLGRDVHVESCPEGGQKYAISACG